MDPNLLVTASSAAAHLIKANKLQPLLLISPDTIEEFEPYYSQQTQIINSRNYSAIDSVFIGLAKLDFVYHKLNIAFHCLHYNKKCQLYAINQARYFNEKNTDNVIINTSNEQKTENVPENINNLATGPFVKGLEYSANVESIVIGKPSKYFFEDGLHKIGCDFDECVMIGDARDDVYGAMQFGMKGILVRTGKYIENDENKIDPQPTVTLAKLRHALNKMGKTVNFETLGSLSFKALLI